MMDILANQDISADKANIGTIGWFCKYKSRWCRYAVPYGDCCIMRADGTLIVKAEGE